MDYFYLRSFWKFLFNRSICKPSFSTNTYSGCPRTSRGRDAFQNIARRIRETPDVSSIDGADEVGSLLLSSLCCFLCCLLFLAYYISLARFTNANSSLLILTGPFTTQSPAVRHILFLTGSIASFTPLPYMFHNWFSYPSL